MGYNKKCYEAWLDLSKEAQLELEIEKAFDKIIDYKLYDPPSHHVKSGFDNLCRHERSEHPMAIMGLSGMWYYCKKCGNPIAKFIPYNERPDV